MSPDAPAGAAVTVLLILTVVVCALSCVGLLVMKGFYNKLHYLAPPAILGTAAVAAAIVAQEGMSATAIKAGLVLLVMVITNPIITFAAARTKHIRNLQVEGEAPSPGEEETLAPRPPEKTPQQSEDD